MPDSDQEGRDLQDKGIERSKKIQPLPRNPVVVTVIAGGPVLVVDPDRRGRVVGALDDLVEQCLFGLVALEPNTAHAQTARSPPLTGVRDCVPCRLGKG